MATSFNISQATELPVGIQQAPDSTPTRAKRINKVIPNQSWSMIQTLRFIQLQGQNLRDPSELGALISQTLTTAIDQGDSNTEKLNNLYTESETRRLDLELDPIDENLYKNQRDPRNPLVQKLHKEVENPRKMKKDLWRPWGRPTELHRPKW